MKKVLILLAVMVSLNAYAESNDLNESDFGEVEFNLGFSDIDVDYGQYSLSTDDAVRLGVSVIGNRYFSVNADYTRDSNIEGYKGELFSVYGTVGNYFEVKSVYLRPFVLAGGARGSLSNGSISDSESGFIYGWGLKTLFKDGFSVTVDQKFTDFDTIDLTALSFSVGYRF